MKKITIVSGLPRSGTSMMMQMLQAGGMPTLTDEIRAADDDNPLGYYEFEPVKNLRTHQDWMPKAMGKAVKVISYLLPHLPESFEYNLIFMRRALPEILASQRQMLVRRNKPIDDQSDETMTVVFEKNLQQVTSWLKDRSNFRVMYVNHRDTIERSGEVAASVNEFIGGTFDVNAMTEAINSKLYRQRA